jgi:cytosine/uracil/thiamine/allantoin permease
MGFMQWVHGLDGQFLLTKIMLSKLVVRHLQSVVEIPTMENIHYVSIWLARMLRICHVKMAMVKNLCSWHHQNNPHLQLSTSIGNS